MRWYENKNCVCLYIESKDYDMFSSAPWIPLRAEHMPGICTKHNSVSGRGNRSAHYLCGHDCVICRCHKFQPMCETVAWDETALHFVQPSHLCTEHPWPQLTLTVPCSIILTTQDTLQTDWLSVWEQSIYISGLWSSHYLLSLFLLC